MWLCEAHLTLPPPFGAHGRGQAKNKKLPLGSSNQTYREQAPQPIKRKTQATMEKKPKAPTKRAQSPKPLAQAATMEKQPKAPTKRSLKQEQELEREERAQKTERLRKLRLAKEAADREKDQR